MDFASVEALAKLLAPPGHDDQSDHLDDKPTPATIIASGPTPAAAAARAKKELPKARRLGARDIWDEGEVPADSLDVDDEYDDRRRPKYEFLYKQAVSAQDAYLGLAGKDPSTHCCEELLVRLSLPGTKAMSELDLDVTDTHLRLLSPSYRLSLPLPHKVDCKRGSAKWDKAAETLSITAPICRDDDYLP